MIQPYFDSHRLTIDCLDFLWNVKHFVNPLEIFLIEFHIIKYDTPSLSPRLHKNEPLLYFLWIFFEIQSTLFRSLEYRFCHLIPSLPPLLSLTLFSPFIFLIIWNTPKSNQGMSEFEFNGFLNECCSCHGIFFFFCFLSWPSTNFLMFWARFRTLLGRFQGSCLMWSLNLFGQLSFGSISCWNSK